MGFQKRITAGEFVVLAEMNTPKGVDISDLITNARKIKDRVDAVVIPDMDNGIMKMSAIGGAVLMNRQGIESIMHVYGRDRNRMAIQGDLLAAHVLGIQNLIVVPGEEMANGDHRDAVSVEDLNELQMLEVIGSLQSGKDMSGFELNGAPSYFSGCAMQPWENDQGLDDELDAAKKKIDAGAQFIITPPVFDVDDFGQAMKKIAVLGVPVIPTIFLLKSVGIARYMAINEPGARISEDLIKRIRKAPDREVECLRIAGETISTLRGMVQGVKIQTLGWEHRLPAILDFAGI